MVLCKVYKKSSRGGPGSSVVPSRCATGAPAPAPRKRKAADAAQHCPEAPTRARRRRQLLLTDDDDGAMPFAEILETELLRCFETENSPAAGGEPAAPEHQDRPSAAAPPPCATRPEEAGDDDDEVMEISLEEFLGSSAAGAAPTRTAQPDGDVVEVSPEKKLMGASAPSERSGGTPSALIDDDDDICGLACPPMDEAYVQLILSEHIVQFDPTFIEEFISDM